MITLRPFTMADATDEYWSSLRNPEINRHLDSRPWSYTEAGLERKLAELRAGTGWMFSVYQSGSATERTPEGFYNYKVSLPAPVGTCTIRYEGEPWHGVAVFGLMLYPAYHGQGYGTATIREATRVAFERYYLRKIWAGVHRPNGASSRAFQKAGWTHEGTFGAHRREDMGSAVVDVDVEIWATWRDKWLASNAARGPRSSTTVPSSRAA